MAEMTIHPANAFPGTPAAAEEEDGGRVCVTSDPTTGLMTGGFPLSENLGFYIISTIFFITDNFDQTIQYTLLVVFVL